MKTELRIRPHSTLAGEHIYELWYAGELIGTVAGSDGPGVRVITKHAMEVLPDKLPDHPIHVTEVRIKCRT
jgi:hypothetical protein